MSHKKARTVRVPEETFVLIHDLMAAGCGQSAGHVVEKAVLDLARDTLKQYKDRLPEAEGTRRLNIEFAIECLTENINSAEEVFWRERRDIAWLHGFTHPDVQKKRHAEGMATLASMK